MNELNMTASALQTAPRDLPPTTLIICSRNRPQLLLETVESVLRGREVPAELVIIDQSDVTHAVLTALKSDRACEIRYRWSQTIGLSRARNIALTLASYEILVFTDDDVIVEPTWFGTIVRALVAAGPRSVITGQVQPGVPLSPDGFVPALKVDPEPAVYEGRPGKDVLFPLNMALYSTAIEEVGNFDERLGAGGPFPGAEDNDFGFRLLEAGYCIRYVPEAVIHHRAWRTAKDYLRLRWGYGLGRGGFYAKYFSWRDRYMLKRMIKDVRIHLVSFFYRLRRERRRAVGDAALVAGILFGAVRWSLTVHREEAMKKTPVIWDE